jgi:hypothetical protein
MRNVMSQEPHTPYVLTRARDLPEDEEGDLIEVASWPFGNTRLRLMRVP